MTRHVASRRRCIGATGTGLVRADGPRSVAGTASAAVALSVRSTRRCAAVCAHPVEVEVVGRDIGAVTWRAGKVAGSASSVAGGVATDAVHAMVRGALSGILTALSEALRAAAAVHALASRRTVVVGTTALDARSADAQERIAINHASRAAGPGTVATPRSVEEVANAGGREALRVRRVIRAAPLTVAGAVVAATRSPLIDADTMRICPTGGDRPAGTEASWKTTGDTSTFAGDIATLAVGAEPRAALGVGGAVRSDGLHAATSVCNIANHSRGALGVTRARLEAAPSRRVTGRVAGVRRTDRRGRIENTRTSSVAAGGSRDGRAVACPIGARRSEIQPAGTGTVTGSVQPTGRRVCGRAISGGTWADARRTREAVPHLAWSGTGLTAVRAGTVTTNTFDTMVRGALSVRSANPAEHLEVAAAVRTTDVCAAIRVDFAGATIRLRVASLGNARRRRPRDATSSAVAGRGRRPNGTDAGRLRAHSVRISEARRDGDAVPGPWIATDEISGSAERTRSVTGFVATVAVSAEAGRAFTIPAAGSSQRKASIVSDGRRPPVAGRRPDEVYVDAADPERDRKRRGQSDANRTVAVGR